MVAGDKGPAGVVPWSSGGRRLAAAGTILVLAAAGWGCAETPSGPTPMKELPRELTAAEAEVVREGNRFAFDFFREADRVDGDGNIFLSPLSASMALGMTMNGARAETLDEMRAALGFDGLELQQINESYRGLMDLLLGLDRGVDLRIANSIWYRRDFPFDEPFFRTAREHFDAEVRGIDMVEGDRGEINAWVDRATNGKIPTIVDRIGDEHMMFLINALYFKGSWTQRFERGDTRDASFHLDNGTVRQVPMMNGRSTYGYASRPGYEVIELPYGNGSYVMTVVLPAEGSFADDLVSSLDAAAWEEMVEALRPAEVELSLPRFRLEYEQELKETLESLGILSAFSPRADFSGMSSASGQGLSISRVVQKTFVDVNEEGTEAAAATSVEIVLVSMPQTLRVVVDRPFLFAIRERFSGTILFMGKVVDPS